MTTEKQLIQRALEKEQRTAQRQVLLKRLWKLEQAGEHENARADGVAVTVQRHGPRTEHAAATSDSAV